MRIQPPPTFRQKDCLDFISAHYAKHGVSPSYDEIAEALGLTAKSGVHRLVHGLIEKGHIIKAEPEAGKDRRIRALVPINRAMALEDVA